MLAVLTPAWAPAQTDPLPQSAPDSSVPHAAVVFLHDQFHLHLTSDFAASTLASEGGLPGPMGLTHHGQAALQSGPGYRQNSVPFQAGEFYWLGGAGAEVGIRADRLSWEAEPLGYPPSGADDPGMLPGPFDSAYFFPVPLYGYEAAELAFWRDPKLPDSARATARYTNGPAGYSYTGGRLRSELGAGFETDAQVYRIFSDGTEDSSRFDGHNLDLEVRRAWGRVPTRLRFRQNRGDRDLLFRWQVDPSRAAHRYYLTHLTLEAALPKAASEWLLAYDLRVADQELRAVPALASYQYWFERTHRFVLSRVSEGRLAYWGSAGVQYREADAASGLPDAWAPDIEAGAKVSGSRASWLLSGGARLASGREAEMRLSTALRFELAPGHRLLAYAGAAREDASTQRRYLPADSGSTYAASGLSTLPLARHESAALAWRYERPRLSWNLITATGRSFDLPDWTPAGDSATLSARYSPVPTDRSGSTLAARATVRPAGFLELEGAWRHDWPGDPARVSAFTPEDDWFAALRVPIRFAPVPLRLVPQAAATGARGGTLPEDWWSLSLGVVATLKHLTVFWFRDNALDEPFRTGGAYSDYGAHARFGFHWNFWN
jgi:hypothetical protein